jgi:hypothetical protein
VGAVAQLPPTFGAVAVEQQLEVLHAKVVPASSHVADEHRAVHTDGTATQLKPAPLGSQLAQSPVHAVGRGRHVPVSHELHVPSHAVSQHTPAPQWLLAQSRSALHGCA